LHHIHPLTLFPPHLPTTVTPPTPGWTYSTLLFSNFVEEKRKKRTFLFV
jgi:hypothetical protein